MKLVWDNTGERLFETGVDRGVLFPMSSTNVGTYEAGVAWNGLTAFNASPSGAEPNAFYADNMKYLNLYSAEEFGFSIEAYTYPDEWEACDGSAAPIDGISVGQQPRKAFGFCCRTRIGNDTNGQEHGYKLHLIYNAMAAPAERSYTTVNESPEAITLSWECTTTPVAVTGLKPTAHITIDSTKVNATKLAQFEDMIYGTDPAALSAQPGDWSTNYKKYYTKSGNDYVAVTGDTAPTWANGTYYELKDAKLPTPAEVITFFTGS